MSHPVKGVDHCFVLVDDLDESAAQYAALGFTLSPRGLHSENKGSANYTIMFPKDYLELLGLLRATPENAPRRKALSEQGEGLHAVACRIDDAGAAARALADLGIGTHGLGSFERPVPLPDGGTGIAAFSTVMFDADQVPLGAVFMCQHRTPETVWLPELQNHPNTACGLGAILALSDDPERDSRGFARLWRDGRAAPEPGGFRIDTGADSAPLRVMDRDAMASLYPGIDLDRSPAGAFAGLQVKVADMAAARACLARAGIRAVETGRGLAVTPEQASGAILEFVAA